MSGKATWGRAKKWSDRERGLCQHERVVAAYVFEVEDSDAGSWIAEIAVLAPERRTALRRLRLAGLHKKQIRNQCRPVRSQAVTDFGRLFDDPQAIVRRRLEDDGWTAWTLVAPGLWLDRRISG
jgi:hypothetical protein